MIGSLTVTHMRTSGRTAPTLSARRRNQPTLSLFSQQKAGPLRLELQRRRIELAGTRLRAAPLDRVTVGVGADRGKE